MSEIRKISTVVDVAVSLVINEDELRALDALAGYGIDSFLKVFYAHLGRAYLEPHEAGLRSFFKTVDGCDGLANEANECRKFLNDANRERLKRTAGGSR